MDEAKKILERLKAQYADNDEATRLISQSYEEILTFPPERALKLAKQAECTLSLYF